MLSRLIIFSYKNQSTETEQTLVIAFKTWDKVKPILEVTPVGDVYHLLTGKDFEGNDQSRVVAGLSLLPWDELAIYGRKFVKVLLKAKNGVGERALEKVVAVVQLYFIM